MTEPTSTGIPLQRLLRIRVGLLIACAVLLVAVGAFLLGIKPMVNRVAENQFALTAAEVEASLDAVFSPTEQVLRMSQG